MQPFIHIAYASNHSAACVAQSFLDRINEAVLFPLIIFLTALAFLLFLFGAMRFVWSADDSGGRERGRRHMMFGIIGILVMVSAAAILAIAANTFGLSVGSPCELSPEQQAYCSSPGVPQDDPRCN